MNSQNPLHDCSLLSAYSTLHHLLVTSFMGNLIGSILVSLAFNACFGNNEDESASANHGSIILFI